MLFEKLRAECLGELESFAKLPLTISLVSGTVSRERYQQFLNDLYHVVWHFCPVMAAAASHCPDTALRYFFYEHMEEEKGHEQWVLEDCAAVGGQRFADTVRDGRPRPEIEGMIGFNYWVSERSHPAGALGMVFALEVISSRMAGRAGGGVVKALGLTPPNGVKFLSSHGPMDGDHLNELKEVVDGIRDDRAATILANAVKVNFRLFSAAFG